MPMIRAITIAGIGRKPAMSGATFVAASATKDDSSKPGKSRRALANLRIIGAVETVNVEALSRRRDTAAMGRAPAAARDGIAAGLGRWDMRVPAAAA
jgi:hypothetical protein